MLVELSNQLYQIKFERRQNEYRAFLFKAKNVDGGQDRPQFTYAGFVGSSYCHPNDQFRRATGRKLALARLIELMSGGYLELDKEDRRKIWNIYFETHKKC